MVSLYFSKMVLIVNVLRTNRDNISLQNYIKNNFLISSIVLPRHVIHMLSSPNKGGEFVLSTILSKIKVKCWDQGKRQIKYFYFTLLYFTLLNPTSFLLMAGLARGRLRKRIQCPYKKNIALNKNPKTVQFDIRTTFLRISIEKVNDLMTD